MPELNNAARPLLNKRRKTLLVIGLGTFVLLGVFFWGMMLSSEAYGPNYSARRLAPCAAHLIGTDNVSWINCGRLEGLQGALSDRWN